MHFQSRTLSVTAAIVLASVYGCYVGGGNEGQPPDDSGADAGGGSLPFSADPPNVYVAKVKNILTGLPPTDAELNAVTADPTQLGHLVDGWMATPEYQIKMMHFFELAFQQAQVNYEDYYPFFHSSFDPTGAWVNASMMQNNSEVFARTALAMAKNGQPFTQTLSTRSYMMTTAMKSFWAFVDVWKYDNKEANEPATIAQMPPGQLLSVTDLTQIPLSESLDPKSPNFMKFYNSKTFLSGCHTVTTTASAETIYQVEFGTFHSWGTCTYWLGDSMFNAQTDYSDWQLVTVRQPKQGELTTPFYDVPALEKATELVLNRPYVGFFTTPAFMANWSTNSSNQMRVTMNQAFIVATNAQVDGTDPTVPTQTPGLDATHAGDPACVGCHQILDPSRSILASTFSWPYGVQIDPTWTSQPGLFVFNGVQQPVHDVYDLAGALASHPLVAPGWAQKLCYYVNSEGCVTSDPEFQKIVATFKSSNYSWNALVKAVVTSPITTHVSSTVTATTNGETVAISRRDHLCTALDARLGLVDVCNLDVMLNGVLLSSKALNIVGGMPNDGYARGSTGAVLANDPTLFYRTGMENFCVALAPLVIDVTSPQPGAANWSSTQPDAAIADFVNIVAGLAPSDPRTAPVTQALKAHFTAASAVKGTTAHYALESTFVAACLAPSAEAIGL